MRFLHMCACSRRDRDGRRGSVSAAFARPPRAPCSLKLGMAQGKGSPRAQGQGTLQDGAGRSRWDVPCHYGCTSHVDRRTAAGA